MLRCRWAQHRRSCQMHDRTTTRRHITGSCSQQLHGRAVRQARPPRSYLSPLHRASLQCPTSGSHRTSSSTHTGGVKALLAVPGRPIGCRDHCTSAFSRGMPGTQTLRWQSAAGQGVATRLVVNKLLPPQAHSLYASAAQPSTCGPPDPRVPVPQARARIMTKASRLTGSSALAAAAAACLLCGASAAFARGDLLMVAGGHNPLGGSTTNVTYLMVRVRTIRPAQCSAVASGLRAGCSNLPAASMGTLSTALHERRPCSCWRNILGCCYIVDLDEPFPFSAQGYTPSGTYRGSIDISTPAPYPYRTTPEHRKAYDNLTFTGVRSTHSVCLAAHAGARANPGAWI